MRRSKARRIISIFMLITMMLGVLPSIPQFNERYLLHAAPKDDWGGEEDGSTPEYKPSQNVPYEELEGLDLRSEGGGSNLRTRGTYMGEDDDYFYIYEVAKKAASGNRYSTIGYSMTSEKINQYTEDVWKGNKGLALLITPQGEGVLSTPESGPSELQTLKVENKVIGPSQDSGSRGGFIDREITSTDDIKSVASFMKYEKANIMKLLNTVGTANKLKWETKTVNGKQMTIANIYLQPMTAIYMNTSKPTAAFMDYIGLNEYMLSKSFSPESREDVENSFNLRIYVKKESNTITYLDVENNKILKTEDSPSINPPNSKLTTIKYTKGQDPVLKFEGDDKRYTMVAGALTAKGYFNESSKSSQYLDQVIVANKNKGKVGMATLAASAEDFPGLLNHLARVSNKNLALTKSWKVSSGSSAPVQYLDPMKVPGGAARTAVAIVELDPSANSLTFEASMGFANDTEALEKTGYSGYQLYVFCEPVIEEKTGDVVWYNDTTGEYLGSEKLNYTKIANDEVKKKYPKTQHTSYVGYFEYGKWEPSYNPDEAPKFIPPKTVTKEIPIYYNFKGTQRTLSNRILNFEGSDSKFDVDINEDILQTRRDVLAGLKVLQNGPEQTTKKTKLKSHLEVTEYYDAVYNNLVAVTSSVRHPDEGVPLYRGTYAETSPIVVLYYAENNGNLIYRETAYPAENFACKPVVTLNNLKYDIIKTSYKVGVDPETDIANTKSPVMTTEDIDVTEGNNRIIPKNIMDSGNYIIRAECSLIPPEKEGPVEAKYIIPSQYLGKQFSYSKSLEAEVFPLPPIPNSSHTYYDSCCDDDPDDSCPGHTCTISWKDTYGEHAFDWDNRLSNILSPLNYVFADLGGLTNISEMIAKGNSHHISTDLSLNFFSHRVDVDGVKPTFAAYMEKENKEAKDFLFNHSMGALIDTGLIPIGNYNDKGGVITAKVDVTPGIRTDLGQDLLRTSSHSSCGDEGDEIEMFVNTSKYTKDPGVFTVGAEPLLVGKELPIGKEVNKALNKPIDKTQTFINTLPGTISFYPYFEMFTGGGGSSAKLLGNRRRELKSVNVAQITSPIDQIVVDVASTWSRDKQDSGKLVMKGGYQYAITSNKPAEFKVETFIVVPKEKFVDDYVKVRAGLLKEHDDLVNSLKIPTNFKIISNLPEAYNDTYPAEFKVQNPHKRAGDNVVKSRIPQPIPNIQVSATTKQVMKVEALDSMFADVDNATRIKAQLETRDWYSEHFDGFEVIKQTTVIRASVPRTTATNFLKNGGTGYNDLARKIQNIPANIYGMGLSLYQPKAKFMSKELDVLLLTKPSLFNVRGLVYEDRN